MEFRILQVLHLQLKYLSHYGYDSTKSPQPGEPLQDSADSPLHMNHKPPPSFFLFNLNLFNIHRSLPLPLPFLCFLCFHITDYMAACLRPDFWYGFGPISFISMKVVHVLKALSGGKVRLCGRTDAFSAWRKAFITQGARWPLMFAFFFFNLTVLVVKL